MKLEQHGAVSTAELFLYEQIKRFQEQNDTVGVKACEKWLENERLQNEVEELKIQNSRLRQRTQYLDEILSLSSAIKEGKVQ